MTSRHSDDTQPDIKPTVVVAFGRSSRPPRMPTPPTQKASPWFWLAIAWNLIVAVYIIASVLSGDLP